MIEKNNFEQEVMEQIKHRRIHPRPQWLFVLKNFSFWLLGTVALALGAISSALLIYFFQGGTASLHRRAGASPAELFLLSVPLFWIVVTVGLIYWTYINVKNTNRGYRHSPWLVGGVILLVSLVSGFTLFSNGFVGTIDNILGRRLPFYEYVINPQIGFWSDADHGRLSGVIISQDNNGQDWLLADRQGQVWQVDISRLQAPGGRLVPDFSSVARRPIGLWGRKIADYQFEAREFFPLRGGEGFFGQPRPLINRPLNGHGPGRR